MYKFLYIVIIFFLCERLKGQVIKGVVNEYAAALSISNYNHSNEDTISVSAEDVLKFKAGDTVLIYQAKASEYLFSNDSVKMTKDDFAGHFEFLRIKKITGNHLVLNRNLSYNGSVSYDVKGKVQVVRVPGYRNPTVTSDQLTCSAWDGNRGGVIALIATSRLTIDGSINASFKGFKGGSYSVTSLIPSLLCVSTHPSYGNRCSQLSDSSYAGLKGEGAFSIPDSLIRGRGFFGNSGGGAVGFYSGGGGGSNAGSGGRGGEEANPCIAGGYMAEGGQAIYSILKENNSNTAKAFFGGAGGAGVFPGSLSAPAKVRGKHGGGLIIIVAEEIVSNGGNVLSTGQPQETSSGGGGGGGAGGSVLIDAQKYSGTLNISVRGSRGDHSDGCPGGSSLGAGGGGGGGGGLIWLKQKNIPAGVLCDTSGGLGGLNATCINNNSTAGEPGHVTYNLIMPLKGLTFNALPDSQVICSGDEADTIVGTAAKQSAPTYLWQSSTNLTIWNDGVSTKDHKPLGALTQTTYFRRIVTANGFTDTSNICMIKVYPPINPNVITSDVSKICQNVNRNIAFASSLSPSGGIPNVSYAYQWQYLDGSWYPVSLGTTENCSIIKPPVTREYRRLMSQKGKCISISSTIKITIVDSIKRNKIGIGTKLTLKDTVLCKPQVPGWLKGDINLGGGNGTYTYSWERSLLKNSWIPVAASADYECMELSNNALFRRVVNSDVCKSYSDTISIILLDSITNADFYTGPFCRGDTVVLSSAPSGGNNMYSYLWEQSNNSSSWTPVGSLRDLTLHVSDSFYIRRTVTSGLHGCCKYTSPLRRVKLFPLSEITSIRILDPAICQGDSMHVQISFKGIKPWSMDHLEGSQKNIATDVHTFSYIPKNGYFSIKQSIDWNKCRVKFENPNLRYFAFYPLPHPQIIADTSICGLSAKIYIQNLTTKGTWSYTGSINAKLTEDEITAFDYGTVSLIFTENNGICSAKDTLKLTFYKMPNATILADDYQKIYNHLDKPIEAADPGVGMGTWTVLAGEGVIENPTSRMTKINHISYGVNSFQWKVKNGACTAVDETSMILSYLKIPTGFSPNGDQMNEKFVVIGMENAGTRELTVFSSWGSTVYHYSD